MTGQKAGYKTSVSVYDGEGTLLYSLDSHDNYISDAVVTEDGRSLLAVTLDTQDGVFASRLRVYDLNPYGQLGAGHPQGQIVEQFAAVGNELGGVGVHHQQAGAQPPIAVGGVGGVGVDVLGTAAVTVTERGLQFFSARFNRSDYLAVTGQKAGYKTSVSVYDGEGTLLYSLDSQGADCRRPCPAASPLSAW